MLLGALVYTAFVAILFRDGGLGTSGGLPEGTNALDAWVTFSFLQHHPYATWLFPFTDWGQPYPGFTGPTLLTPAIVLVNPTILVRSIEFVSFVLAGVGVMAIVQHSGGTPLGGFLGGLYYTTFAQTPEFFEGHVPAMLSLALGPLFLYSLWRFLKAPKLAAGVGSALLLFLLISVGDLGILYFYVFFAVLVAGYTILRRQWPRHYSLRELAAIVAAAALVVVLSTSWLYPYAVGLRPEYTTNVTVTILPFSLTTGESFLYLFIGYIQDNSFVFLTYHEFAFGIGGSLLLPFSLILPVAVSVYALRSRSLDRIALYASGVLAMVFGTGNLYPVLSQFNRLVYYGVPYFDAIPALFRWAEYSLLVYGLLLGGLVSALDRDSHQNFSQLRGLVATYRGRLARLLKVRAAEPGRSVRLPAYARKVTPRTALFGLCGCIVILILAQNAVVVTQPLGIFEFPPAYTASYQYLDDHSISGEVLTLPFGGIYDRGPWGGVSASAALLTPITTGADTVIFQAGTPYSLAIDNFVNGGLTFGGSRNMTKFLGSANVQYIVTTRYTNWNYSSSAEAAPMLSYTSLANQTGIGRATNISSLQSVYTPGNAAGNLSFHPSYLLYFGTDSMIYAVLDSPWYPGPAMALVNGSTLGSNLEEYLIHSAGVVVSPQSLVQLGLPTLTLAHSYHVPVIEIVSPTDLTGNGTQARPDAWNVTGGVDLQFDGANSTATVELASNLLTMAGYTDLSLSSQISAPPNSVVATRFGNVTVVRNWTGSSVLSSARVNDSSVDFFIAGEENNTLNSTGLVKVSNSSGTTYANWTPLANASDFQYLRFGARNLSHWNGFSVDVRGENPVPLEARIAYGTSTFDLPGYATSVPTPANGLEYRFLFPSGGFGIASRILSHLGNLSEVEIGIPAPGVKGSIVVSNVTLLNVSDPRLATIDFNPIPAATSTFSISLSPTGRLGFLEISTGADPLTAVDQTDFLPQSSPIDLAFSPTISGWGILTLAQTFSPLWQLTGVNASGPSVVDVGLTGWLIASTAGGSWHIVFAGTALEATALVVESIVVPIVAIPIAAVLVLGRTGALPGRRRP